MSSSENHVHLEIQKCIIFFMGIQRPVPKLRENFGFVFSELIVWSGDNVAKEHTYIYVDFFLNMFD